MEPVKVELYDINHVKIDESLVAPTGLLVKPITSPSGGGSFVTLFGALAPAPPFTTIGHTDQLPS